MNLQKCYLKSTKNTDYKMDTILELYKPLYLESQTYIGKTWKLKKDCKYYTNRKLIDTEIVADFDKLNDFYVDYIKICSILEEIKLKFWVYQSGLQGLHVHFFTKFTDKLQKKIILELLEQKVGYSIDKNPTNAGVIRAEGSVHPTKKFKKVLLYTNVHPKAYLSTLFYFNTLDTITIKKLFRIKPQEVVRDDIDNPKTIQIMLKHKFIDGHKRIMFCLVSYYKNKLSDEDIYTKIKDWVRYQDTFIPDIQIKASIKSSKGSVRDSYRIKLLQELGFMYEDLVTKVEVQKVTGVIEGF